MRYKLVFAIVICVLLIGGGVWERIFVQKTFDELSEKIDILIDMGDDIDIDTVYTTEKWLEKAHGKLEYVIPHYQLNEISVTFGEFKGAVEAEDIQSAIAQLHRLRENTERLSDMYKITPSNVL